MKFTNFFLILSLLSATTALVSCN